MFLCVDGCLHSRSLVLYGPLGFLQSMVNDLKLLTSWFIWKCWKVPKLHMDYNDIFVSKFCGKKRSLLFKQRPRAGVASRELYVKILWQRRKAKKGYWTSASHLVWMVSILDAIHRMVRICAYFFHIFLHSTTYRFAETKI